MIGGLLDQDVIPRAPARSTSVPDAWR